jgi:FkbM family methyltransferase
VFAITSILPPLPRIKIVDVGAMSLGENTQPYADLMRATPCDIIGFEPVSGEFESLKKTRKGNEKFLPFFVGDGTRRTFYECNAPMTSSLFEPNMELVSKFQNLDSFMRVVKTYPVETTRLDDIPSVRGTDLLKVDVQGAELLVLQGGVKMLRDVLAVQTEVEFLPLYKDQPLFSDVDAFLRARGFQFHTMKAHGRTFKPLVSNNDLNAAMSQLLWADVIYVRDFLAFDRMPPSALIKLACILHENYRSHDLAAVALAAHDRQTGTQLNATYLQRLLDANKQV